MISEGDRREVADLAMRALDTIMDEYGEDANLCAASLVFEIVVPEDGGDPLYHTNYKSLERNSPNHIGGLLYGVGMYLLAPGDGDA